MEEIYGKWDDSFIQVGALREGIMSLNPGSVVDLKTEPDQEKMKKETIQFLFELSSIILKHLSEMLYLLYVSVSFPFLQLKKSSLFSLPLLTRMKDFQVVKRILRTISGTLNWGMHTYSPSTFLYMLSLMRIGPGARTIDVLLRVIVCL